MIILSGKRLGKIPVAIILCYMFWLLVLKRMFFSVLNLIKKFYHDALESIGTLWIVFVSHITYKKS